MAVFMFVHVAGNAVHSEIHIIKIKYLIRVCSGVGRSQRTVGPLFRTGPGRFVRADQPFGFHPLFDFNFFSVLYFYSLIYILQL